MSQEEMRYMRSVASLAEVQCHNIPLIDERIAASLDASLQNRGDANTPKRGNNLHIFVWFPFRAKVRESRNRPSVAQRVPGGLGSQIIMTFGT
jgi:hypothetical protein